MGDIPACFDVPAESFSAQYGWPKPAPGTHALVFFCKMGSRAGRAAQAAAQRGYESYCYVGSWTEWKAKQASEGRE